MMSASATTEHSSSGQIGHPAACMIDSKGFSAWRGRAAAAREIMAERRPAARRAAPTSKKVRWAVHRFCGQLCGEARCGVRKPASMLVPGLIAQLCINDLSLKINDLDEFDKDMTGAMPVSP